MSLALSLCQYVLRPRRASARPRRASKRLDCRLCNRKGKIVMIKASRYMGLVLGSFLAPQTDMIFGDGVGASLVWADSESYEVQTNDVLRAVAAIQHLSSAMPPDSPFLRALGTTAALKAPPQTDTLAQRALEEWERTLCENKAGAILVEVQAGRPTIIHKDGGEMLIAIVLDRPLAEAKELVDDQNCFSNHHTASNLRLR